MGRGRGCGTQGRGGGGMRRRLRGLLRDMGRDGVREDGAGTL